MAKDSKVFAKHEVVKWSGEGREGNYRIASVNKTKKTANMRGLGSTRAKVPFKAIPWSELTHTDDRPQMSYERYRSMEDGGGVEYFTMKDGSKMSKDEWYKGMEENMGFDKFAERILKDSQFGRTTTMPKNEFKHNRNIARATIEDNVVTIDHSPKGIKENQSGEMVHTFKDLRKLTEFLQREKIYAHGGKMKQGYNDRMDDSLGNRRGKASSKEQDYKDRRDEAKAMNKAEGKRAYQSVGTMDKMADGGEVYKKGDTVLLQDGNIQKTATVVADGIDSKNRVRVRPQGFPMDMSISTIKNDRVYIIKKMADGGRLAEKGDFYYLVTKGFKGDKTTRALSKESVDKLIERHRVGNKFKIQGSIDDGRMMIIEAKTKDEVLEEIKKMGRFKGKEKQTRAYKNAPLKREYITTIRKTKVLAHGGGIDGQTFRSAVLWAQGDIEENYNYEDSDLNIQHDLMSDHTELYKAANKFGIQDEGDWREIYEVAFEEMGIENPPQFKSGGKTDDWIQGVEAEMKKKGTVGAFTKQAKRAGMTVKEFTKEVLDNPDKYSKRTRERAQFAKNVSKYESGGLFDSEGRKYNKKKGSFLTSEWFTGDLDFLNY